MVEWLSDEEMAAWRGLVDVHAELSAELDMSMHELHGLSIGDYGVLVQLSEAPDDRMRMCDLASSLHLSPSGLTRRLDGLVRAGVVERRPSPGDGRVMLAVLTTKGRTLIERAAPDHVEGVRRGLLDHLTPDQIAALGSALRSVLEGRRTVATGRSGPTGRS